MDNGRRNAHGDFIFDGIRNNIPDDLFRVVVLSGFDDRKIGRVLRCGLMESNFDFFSINSRLDYVLFIINITRHGNVLNSASALVNRLSGDGIQVHYIIPFLSPIHMNVFFLVYRLHIGLGNVLVSRDHIVQGFSVVQNYRLPVDRGQGFFNLLSRYKLNILFNFSNLRLYYVAVVDNIPRDVLYLIPAFILELSSLGNRLSNL